MNDYFGHDCSEAFSRPREKAGWPMQIFLWAVTIAFCLAGAFCLYGAYTP